MSGPFKEHGRALVDNGYAIIPILPGTKGPTHKGWQEDYANDEASFKRMLADLEDARSGVGIITEFTPGIDIDCKNEDVVRHMVEFCKDNLGDAPERVGNAPKTLLLYAADEPFLRIASASYMDPRNPEFDKKGKRKGQRIEILAKGQQFVAYHIHPDTGKPYEWTQDWENPLDVPVLDLSVITPKHAMAVCREFERLCEELGWEKVGEGSYLRNESSEDADDALGELDPPEETEVEVARVKSALEKIKEVISNYDYDEWRNLLFALKWTRWECSESLAREVSEASEWHVTKTFNTVWRGAQKRERGREVTLGTLFKMAKAAGWDAKAAPSVEKETAFAEVTTITKSIKGPQDRDAIKSLVRKLAEVSLDGSDEYTILSDVKKVTNIPLSELRKQIAEARRDIKKSKVKPTHAGYAAALLELIEEDSGVAPVACGGALYIYNDAKGIYEQQTIENVVGRVVKHFDDSELCVRGSDYNAIAKLAVTTKEKKNFFDDAPIGLACKGRFYFINEDGEIEKEALSSKHRQRFLTTVSPVVGETPLFDKFLQETFADNDAEGQVMLLQEVFGAILIGYMPQLEKALFLKGPGRSGKSTLLKIIRAMFHLDVQCASSPFDWDREYERASLLGKRLNIVGELPLDKPIPAHDFKTITGRDPINARMPYGSPFTFTPTASHIFSSNHYIYSTDHTEAFYARFVTIECANSRAFNDEQIITDLAERIIEAELPAIMAWSLQGAKRLMDNRGVLTRTKTSVRMMSEWMRSSNSLMEFVTDEDVVEFGPQNTHVVYRPDLYTTYVEWCKESGRRPMSKRRVYEELVSGPFKSFMLRPGTTADGKKLFRGLRLKHDTWGAVPDEEDDEL